MPSVDFLRSFADAWNRHDLDALLQHMAPDGVFVSSSGARAQGTEAVRSAFAGVFEAFPDARWTEDEHFVAGNRGVSEWTFTGTDAEDGSRVQERGCDLFTFRDGRILRKDTYLK